MSTAQTRPAINDLVEAQVLLPVPVPGWRDLAYLHGEAARPRAVPGAALLCPFDPLVWERDRTERIFDFHYRIEIYTPAAKRQFGYYSMPILHRGAIIGQIDPSFDRRSKYLTVKALHVEPGVKPTEPMMRAIAKALDDLTIFLGGQPEDWDILTSSSPEALRMIYP